MRGRSFERKSDRLACSDQFCAISFVVHFVPKTRNVAARVTKISRSKFWAQIWTVGYGLISLANYPFRLISFQRRGMSLQEWEKSSDLNFERKFGSVGWVWSVLRTILLVDFIPDESWKCRCKRDKNIFRIKLCAQFGLSWLGPDQFSFVVDYLPKTGNAVAVPTSNQDQRPESAGLGGCILTSKERKKLLRKKQKKFLYSSKFIPCSSFSIKTIGHNLWEPFPRSLHSTS